ncbi:MAG: aminotransferase class V-fold PLP-dependent enzyme [Deltaproteobacteria bacterium]|nr:aminotransferase class V-fold PLP-dependent enzyme [Deltaproteobacteria bacterium]MBW2351972.1 aminotransferase class V-fold PLP-dependent enzyme [Deltaproteobacteria bacterium]HDZ89746.1 aminotransferase class V-fold PLP-dependent enzyme [Deltaproteobacteria bacterium]
MKRLIYLDNAATSFPKPPEVMEAMLHFMKDVGANPGRSGHYRAVEADRIVRGARESVARLFNIPKPDQIVFTMNVTEALNVVINGFLKQGDHVITTSMEHNSVLRPLRHLEKIGTITLSIVQCDNRGRLDPREIPPLIGKNTALMVLNQASNVCGTIQDVRAVKRAIGEIPLLLDVAQTAGCFPIDVEADGIDFLAFTGHKAMLGPQGTGGLYIREGLSLEPLTRGGTGSVSEEEFQPGFMPDMLESGTRNNVGIAGLGAGVDFVLRQGVSQIMEHDRTLTAALLSALHDVAGVTVYGPLNAREQTSTISITFDSLLPPGARYDYGGCGAVNLGLMEEDIYPAEAGSILNTEYDILVRTGLHCAPIAHKTLKTFPEGTVRISMGYFNTLEEVEIVAAAIRRIASREYS